MTDKEQLFFELIRVAIGTQDCLSRLPSEVEWDKLYKLAEKQSLSGICFAGLLRLGADGDEGFEKIGMSEMQFLNWMGVAAQIQLKNELVDKQCVELQDKFNAEGFRSSILKGQGIEKLYCKHLHDLRQPGDIDIYVDCGQKKAIHYAKGIQGKVDWDYKHLHLKIFEETEVEMHYRPEYLANLCHNRIFQNWAEVNREHVFERKMNSAAGTLNTPDTIFNCVYVLSHIYSHNMRAGVGLRQLMDYYFVLNERCLTDTEKSDLICILRKLGMLRYTSGVMWLLQTVFGMKDEYLLCEPDQEEGQFILDGVLIGGNMGRGYYKKKQTGPRVKRFISDTFSYSARAFRRYPIEAIAYPIWTVYHFLWKRVWRLVNGV